MIRKFNEMSYDFNRDIIDNIYDIFREIEDDYDNIKLEIGYIRDGNILIIISHEFEMDIINHNGNWGRKPPESSEKISSEEITNKIIQIYQRCRNMNGSKLAGPIVFEYIDKKIHRSGSNFYYWRYHSYKDRKLDGTGQRLQQIEYANFNDICFRQAKILIKGGSPTN
jgi:hypothetical protein